MSLPLAMPRTSFHSKRSPQMCTRSIGCFFATLPFSTGRHRMQHKQLCQYYYYRSFSQSFSCIRTVRILIHAARCASEHKHNGNRRNSSFVCLFPSSLGLRCLFNSIPIVCCCFQLSCGCVNMVLRKASSFRF